jgi:hypothetical protein
MEEAAVVLAKCLKQHNWFLHACEKIPEEDQLQVGRERKRGGNGEGEEKGRKKREETGEETGELRTDPPRKTCRRLIPNFLFCCKFRSLTRVLVVVPVYYRLRNEIRKNLGKIEQKRKYRGLLYLAESFRIR